MDVSDPENISSSQKKQIEKEMKEMEEMCSLGMREESDIEDLFKREIFKDLLNNFEEKCPLLHNVLQTLLVTDKRQRVYKTSEYKLTFGVNAVIETYYLVSGIKNVKIMYDCSSVLFVSHMELVNSLSIF